MSYRTTLVNSKGEQYQILGNNEYAKGMREWIESEGGTVDGDDCYYHEIKDINKLIDIFEEYIQYQDEWRSKDPFNVDIYNLRPIDDIAAKKSITLRMLNKIEGGIIFVSAQTILFFKDDLEKSIDFGGEDRKMRYVYKIKEGRKLYIRAG